MERKGAFQLTDDPLISPRLRRGMGYHDPSASFRAQSQAFYQVNRGIAPSSIALG